MSGKGKIGGKHPSLSKSNKAGLIFPVGRISRWIRDGNFAPRSGLGAAVFLAAVLEYMTSEVLEIAGGHVKETGKQRITPQHLQHAVRRDRELAELLANVTIVEGGVLPNDHLLHSMKKKSKTVKPVTNEQPANTNVAADEEEDEAF